MHKLLRHSIWVLIPLFIMMVWVGPIQAARITLTESGADNALFFDSDAAVVDLDPVDDDGDAYSGDWTVEFKIYLDYVDQTGIDECMGVYWEDDENLNRGFYIYNNGTYTNQVSFFDGALDFESDSTLSHRDWNHVAIVYDNKGEDSDSSLKIFINGQLDAEHTFKSRQMALPFNNVTMGASENGNTDHSLFNSGLNDFRIWKVARTETEIKGSMDAEIKPVFNPTHQFDMYDLTLVRYYKFNQGWEAFDDMLLPQDMIVDAVNAGDNQSIIYLYDGIYYGFGSGMMKSKLVNFSLVGTSSNFLAPVVAKTTSTPRVPQKRDPHTLLTGQVGGIQTTDLAYLVAIPEQWMDSTAKVEFWLDAAAVTAKQEGYDYLDTAAATLKTAGAKLIESYDVRLMKRVTGQDGMVSEGEVALEYVRGNLTSRLPIPAQLQNTAHLGLCWIDETGAVAFLESKRVTLDGVSYLEFVNNNFTTAYAFIADPNHAAVVG